MKNSTKEKLNFFFDVIVAIVVGAFILQNYEILRIGFLLEKDLFDYFLKTLMVWLLAKIWVNTNKEIYEN